MAKRKYIDDDTREELKGLASVQFSSEEELQAKLEEIHRKRNEKTISRIMRVCGFIFALILFIASFDVFFERSILGAWFDEKAFNAAKMNDQSIEEVRGPIETSHYLGVTILDTDGNVIVDYDQTSITKDLYEHLKTEALSAGNSITFDCQIYKYNVNLVDKNTGVTHRTWIKYSPNLNDFKTAEDFDLYVKEENPGLAAFRNDWNALITIRDTSPTSELFDDEFYLSYGMVTVLSSVVLLALGALLVFLSAYMIKDIIDTIKGFFLGSRDVVSNVADTAIAPFKKKPSKEEEPEETKGSHKSLFDDEPEVKKPSRKKKTESEKPERKKDDIDDEFPNALSEEEINALLNPYVSAD